MTEQETKAAAEPPLDCRVMGGNGTALERFFECGGGAEDDPIERLRFFCSLVMQGQDWLDAEMFFDDVIAEREAHNAEITGRTIAQNEAGDA